MGGTFSKANRPKLEGAYFNWDTSVAAPLPVSPGTSVALPILHDWGPAGQVVQVTNLQEFKAIFGPSDDTAGYLAVYQAFKGEGVNGRGGAGSILVYRFETEGGKAATIAIKNTEKVALTLVARYPGSYGNEISTEVTVAATSILVIKVGGVEVERYEFAETDVKALGEAIDAESDWVETEGEVVTGKKLDAETDGALKEGADGEVKAADWTAAMTALDTERFAIVAGHAVTEEAVLTAIQKWVTENNEKGNRFFACVGAKAGTLKEAVELADDMSSPEILVVDGVEVTDETAGPGGGSISELDGSQLCSRVAGIFAGRGEYQSLSAARLADTTITEGRSLAEQLEAFDGGVITFARDSNAAAPTHIKTGLSSWTAADAAEDETRPYLIYRQPKYVRTMHGIETDLTQFAETEIIGLRPITAATRDALIAEAKRNLEGRTRQGIILPGWTVGIDQDPPPTDQDEFIALAMSVTFGRALEQVFFTVAIS